jgi:hypothetical protein
MYELPRMLPSSEYFEKVNRDTAVEIIDNCIEYFSQQYPPQKFICYYIQDEYGINNEVATAIEEYIQDVLNQYECCSLIYALHLINNLESGSINMNSPKYCQTRLAFLHALKYIIKYESV